MGSLPTGWYVEELTRIGNDLREIQVRPARTGYLSRWLHGPKYTDIFVDYAPGGDLVRFEASFGGNWFSYQNKVLRTGLTDEMDTESDSGHPTSRFIQEHAQLDPHILEGVRILLQSMPDRFLGDQLLKILPEPPRWPAG